MAVSDIFERWQKPSYVRLHAGEMSAQEMRSVVAVVKAIEAEVSAALSDQVVVPNDGYLEDLKFANEQNIKAARKYKERLEYMEAKYGKIDWDAVPASTPVRSS